MDRLKREYEGEEVNILVNSEEKLLLLLSSRHVTHEKINLSNWFKNKTLETDNGHLRPSDVVKVVKRFIPDLYSTDIKEIKLEDDYYTVSIHPHCLVYFGQFKIKLTKGI